MEKYNLILNWLQTNGELYDNNNVYAINNHIVRLKEDFITIWEKGKYHEWSDLYAPLSLLDFEAVKQIVK